jgi:hypothetical protein
MTKLERKEMTVKMAKKLERGHMLGKVYLSAEGLAKVLEMQGATNEKK